MRASVTFLVLVVFLPLLSRANEVPDSGMVRIRTAEPGTTLSINDSIVTHDSFANQWQADSWFTFRLAAGIHFLRITKDGFGKIEELIAVRREEVTDFTAVLATGVESPGAGRVTDSLRPATAGLAWMLVVSDPVGGQLQLGDRHDELITPVELNLPVGGYTLVMTAVGYQPLNYDITFDSSRAISLNFLLHPEQPSPLTAEQLGMSYQKTIPPIAEENANKLRGKFVAFSEMFAIVPLGQGLLARVLMGESSKSEANALIISGVGLTVTSYLLGRIMSSRKLTKIKRHNADIVQQNKQAKEQNKTIKRLVREKNSEILLDWQTKNSDRGRVVVTEK